MTSTPYNIAALPDRPATESGYSTSTKRLASAGLFIGKNMANKQLPLASTTMAYAAPPGAPHRWHQHAECDEAPDIQVVSIFDTSADYEAFMQQYVEIEIHTTRDKTRRLWCQ